MSLSRLSQIFVLALWSSGCGVGEAELMEGDATEAPEEAVSTQQAAASCGAKMNRFPVAAPHNIGWDSSCNDGTCDISCPDSRANSDWNGPAGHHGIDVFAYRRAPLVAVADGVVLNAGLIPSSGVIRVKIRDACGWEYYYGHLDQVVVSVGQRVTSGQLLGYMGNTGTGGVHLHFNASPYGSYSNDIDPINLLKSTSGTACSAQPPPPPPPPPPAGCGLLAAGKTLGVNQSVKSCDGRFTLVMQGDGNLVLYQGSKALWWTATNGRGAVLAAMQTDGNFVLYTAAGHPVWASGTYGRAGARLAVQNDGNTVIYLGSAAIWHTHTCCR